MVLGWGVAPSHATAQAKGRNKEPDVAQAEPIRADESGQTHAPADRIALERLFEQTMTGVRLEGVSQMTAKGGLRGDWLLSEPRKDGYVISKVSKVAGDRWLIVARIPLGDQEVEVPVPVRVVWAGDTAVITLDDVGVPLIGTYSARVMVHEGFYSGIWYSNGKNYGGVMAGRIIKEADKPGSAPPPAEGESKDAPRGDD